MTPKEKAIELVAKFTSLVDCEVAGENGFEFSKDAQVDNSKLCALIAVDAILSARPGYPYPQELDLEVRGIFAIIEYPEKYWKEVRTEIEKL